MYLFVTLTSAQGRRGLYSLIWVQVWQAWEGMFFFETFRSEREYPISSFWSPAGHGFCTLGFNFVCSVFFKEASFSSLSISNGNRTEWSPIRSVIIRVITKSDDRAAGVRFVYHEYDYRPNWTTRSLITN